MSLKDLMVNEVKKALEKAGLNPNVDFLGNYLTITIPKSDIINLLVQGFPDQFRGAIDIEASDIKIKVRVI